MNAKTTESLKEFPPSQGRSLSINKVLESMMKNQKGQRTTGPVQ